MLIYICKQVTKIKNPRTCLGRKEKNKNTMQKFICCICKKPFHGYGNNPRGAVWKDNGEIVEPSFKQDDRCCDLCDSLYVIPGRIYRITKKKNAKRGC